MGFLDKLFNSDKKILDNVEKAVRPVEALAEKMATLTDEQLKEKTAEFKQRIADGATLDDVMVEAFAVAREAAKRVIGEYPYFCQLEGAYVMHTGDIAEMKTGEGKTLTSVMAVYLNALSGKGVHVITVNEYLAERDSKWMGEIHRFLGLTVGLNMRALTPAQKRAAYECDITYTTNSEVGFDYLRDNMVTRVEDRVLRPLNFALVDEVDSILIDESRTPLIISGGQKQTANQYTNADRFVKRLTNEIDYVIDVKDKNVQLTEEGVHKAEKAFNVANLYDIENTSLVHYINQALKANYIMHLDVEYVVEEGEVIIVDQNTGRKMPGREYSDGLHQAIQAKEGVQIKQETTTLATITYQNFFRLYNKLAGMTGTAKTEEEEFLDIYNMRVVEIPTNRPVARVDYPDLVYGTKKAKYEALLEEVKGLYEKGQPVLVGTISVETSELISRMFKQARIKHEVLNAKNHAREADIIAKAGRPGSVTIATNMAGRGTDIKLTPESKELGGLVVLGSERHESRRIDNQLRGRSGRQGDPGYSRFYVSLQDELMVRFGSDRMMGLFEQMGDVAIENKTVTKAISSAQKRVEGLNFDVRKALLDYDDVMRQQRETMYTQRNYILENEDIHSVVENMFRREMENTVNNNTQEEGKKVTIDYESIVKRISNMGVTNFVKADIEGLNSEDCINKCFDVLFGAYEKKIKPVKEQIIPVEKNMVLRLMDRAWQNQIDVMSKLREGIHLRSYAQNNPLQAYIEEGYELFEMMMNTISNDVVTFCNNLKIVIKEK
ncbi:MAG: preprotein translocase subunit SecA [Erysipelotrichaceae bacterium]|nr:preprotein translocase subunit SecA [Erysipelotrichaceae bacterium]